MSLVTSKTFGDIINDIDKDLKAQGITVSFEIVELICRMFLDIIKLNLKNAISIKLHKFGNFAVQFTPEFERYSGIVKRKVKCGGFFKINFYSSTVLLEEVNTELKEKIENV